MTTILTRRRFVACAAAAPFALRALAEPAPIHRWVFLGTDTGAGIYRCTWNPETGELGTPELAAKTDRPDFLTLHPHLPRLYAVNATSGATAGVSAFHLDRNLGTLRFAGHQPSGGDGPCFVSVDDTGRSAFVANYSSGSFAGYQLTVDGGLLPPSGTLLCHQNPACGIPGPVHDRQDASHLHSATIAPGNGFVIACDLGNDAIDVIAIHPQNDNPLGRVHRFATRPGSGPRHIAFHPNNRWAYVVHELDCTLQLFDWSVTGGKPSLLPQEGTTVRTAIIGSSATGITGCEIIVAPNGKYVYTCTRGEDSITVFRIDAKTGALTEQQRLSGGGKTPRHIAFDPTHRWLLCANQAAPGSVTVFAHEPETGKLTGPIQTLSAETPMFVQFA